jgi:DNA-directed RNA polymerase specialized sigma24 family protein
VDASPFADAWKAYQDARDELRRAKERFLGLFVPRVLGLANRYLRDRSQKEDVAGSVWLSFIQNHDETFEKIQQPGELWELFAAITVRHCSKHNKRRQREYERGPRVSIGTPGRADAMGGARGFDPPDSEPSPSELAVQREVQESCRHLLEECERVLAQQDPERGARRLAVLGMHLAGVARKEMAANLNASIPTIDRDLQEIRAALGSLGAAEDDD